MRDSAFCFPARLSSDICVCPCAVLKPSNAAMNRSAWFIGYSGQERVGAGRKGIKSLPPTGLKRYVGVVRRSGCLTFFPCTHFNFSGTV